jgi:hypothetical protein
MRWVDVDPDGPLDDLPELHIVQSPDAAAYESQLRWWHLWKSRRYKGIQCWCGVPGSGKTYELARWGLEQLAAGRQVYCSYGFDLPGAHTFHDIDEFVSIPDGAAICVDEAPIWFDARAWAHMDRRVLVRLTQIRKFGIDLRYTAIEPTMVELRLRQITFSFVRCKGIYGPFHTRTKQASPDGAPQLRDRDGFPALSMLRVPVCRAYDTKSTADVDRWLDQLADTKPKRR